MPELLFSGRIPVVCSSVSVPSVLKCDILQGDSVEIRLIDTADMFNFYTCSISVGDFCVLKSEQGIRVEYDRFVRILVDMFDAVCKDQLQGVFEEGKFMFVERNEFRNIVRLELKFAKPDEADYKGYLSDVLSKMEQDNISLIKKNNQYQERIKNLEMENRRIKARMDEEISEMKKITNRTIEQLHDKAAQDRRKIEEYENMGAELESLRSKNADLEHENERHRLHQEKLSALEKNFAHLEAENKSLTTQLHTERQNTQTLSQNLAQEKSQTERNAEILTTLEKEAKKNKKEVEELRVKTKALEEKYKKSKEENRKKEQKILTLDQEKKALITKLENAQNVYTHFYTKNLGKEENEEDSGISTIHPEAPPYK